MPKTMDEALAHADALADKVGRDDYEPQILAVEKTEPLDGLSKAVIDVANAQKRLQVWVELARADGQTWPQIAEVLGVTPQAARSRFKAIPNGKREHAS